MSNLAKKYVLFTYLFTWLLWGSIAIGSNFGFLKWGELITMIIFILGGLIPTIVAITLKKINSNKIEFKNFISNIFAFRQKIFWYILILVISFIYAVLPIFLNQALQEQPIYMAFLMFPIMIIGGGLEEIGWRGILQPELQKLFSVFKSTIIVGLIWAIWHVPLWFIIGSNQSGMNFFGYAIVVMSLTFILSFLYNSTKSIFLCIVFHAFINSFWEVFVPKMLPLASMVLLIISLGIFFIFKNKIFIKVN